LASAEKFRGTWFIVSAKTVDETTQDQDQGEEEEHVSVSIVGCYYNHLEAT
jgi:hypothetical protein